MIHLLKPFILLLSQNFTHVGEDSHSHQLLLSVILHVSSTSSKGEWLAMWLIELWLKRAVANSKWTNSALATLVNSAVA